MATAARDAGTVSPQTCGPYRDTLVEKTIQRVALALLVTPSRCGAGASEKQRRQTSIGTILAFLPHGFRDERRQVFRVLRINVFGEFPHRQFAFLEFNPRLG